jgi:ligand-binding sensor domain-containing protein
VGTEAGGLVRLDGTRQHKTLYRHDPRRAGSLSHDRVSALLEDQRGRLWVGTRKGLDLFDVDRNSFVHLRFDPLDGRSLSNDDILALFEDRGGVLWAPGRAASTS